MPDRIGTCASSLENSLDASIPHSLPLYGAFHEAFTCAQASITFIFPASDLHGSSAEVIPPYLHQWLVLFRGSCCCWPEFNADHVAARRLLERILRPAIHWRGELNIPGLPKMNVQLESGAFLQSQKISQNHQQRDTKLDYPLDSEHIPVALDVFHVQNLDFKDKDREDKFGTSFGKPSRLKIDRWLRWQLTVRSTQSFLVRPSHPGLFLKRDNFKILSGAGIMGSAPNCIMFQAIENLNPSLILLARASYGERSKEAHSLVPVFLLRVIPKYGLVASLINYSPRNRKALKMVLLANSTTTFHEQNVPVNLNSSLQQALSALPTSPGAAAFEESDSSEDWTFGQNESEPYVTKENDLNEPEEEYLYWLELRIESNRTRSKQDMLLEKKPKRNNRRRKSVSVTNPVSGNAKRMRHKLLQIDQIRSHSTGSGSASKQRNYLDNHYRRQTRRDYVLPTGLPLPRPEELIVSMPPTYAIGEHFQINSKNGWRNIYQQISRMKFEQVHSERVGKLGIMGQDYFTPIKGKAGFRGKLLAQGRIKMTRNATP